MQDLPKTVLFLTLGGIIPFIWGIFTTKNDFLYLWSLNFFGPNLSGLNISIFYGSIILTFMSGVLWGFATKIEGIFSILGYFLSVIPVFWVLFFVIPRPETAVQNLVIGFIAILVFDWYFWRQNSTPEWWMGLRLSISALVVICLLLARN